MSNSDTQLTRSLYRDLKIFELDAKRSMGVAGGEAKTAREIIAVSKSSCAVINEWPLYGVDYAAGAAPIQGAGF